MDKVIYRSIVKEDYESVKELIGEAFGFNEFIKDKKFLDSVLNIYLQGCILESSFSEVAEKDSKVIGIILGNSKEDKNRLKKAHNIFSLAYSILKVLMTKKENKKFMKEFGKVQDAYKELIHGKENDFQGCIELFIVSGESRGLGVGKTLMNHLFHYMESVDVKSLYLYTDTRCNYGYYDSQNFDRIDEKEIQFDTTEEKLNVFLYSYDF
ncbi:GNAT family N-acetyltransferase [Lysinibacillus xylanilyticus]|uniref:GNAT family N-acetyltransferase n=1 Tax=Lysinibacillus xylanilyticus TaxID=582475 RepID=UPI0036DA1E22